MYQTMKPGYVKLWRRILDHPVMKNPFALSLLTYLLVSVQWEDAQPMTVGNQVVILERGECIVGRHAVCEKLGLTEYQYRSDADLLKSHKIITIKTTTKFSIIRLVEFDFFQKIHTESASKNTSRSPTDRQQI